MVGIVIVSHSAALADSVVSMTRVMADGAGVAAAGGTDEGEFGTSYNKILAAIESVYSDDGVLVLMDMGSAVMTTEMVIESLVGKRVEMVDCPLVEGAVVGTINSMGGMDFDAMKKALSQVAGSKKFG